MSKCLMCNGRGYLGDDYECPNCHPNKCIDVSKRTDLLQGGKQLPGQ